MKTNILYTTATALFLSFFLISANLPTETKMEVETTNAEENLEIEEWMISDTYWGVEDAAKEESIIEDEDSVEIEDEDSVEIEGWMLDDEYWQY
jgi:hypothetical protein